MIALSARGAGWTSLADSSYSRDYRSPGYSSRSGSYSADSRHASPPH